MWRALFALLFFAALASCGDDADGALKCDAGSPLPSPSVAAMPDDDRNTGEPLNPCENTPRTRATEQGD